jgi:hypothetical protein
VCQKTRTYRGSAVQKPEQVLLGEAELVLMRYSGLGMLSETGVFTGTATGARYTFGMDKPLGYVDIRDAPGLLSTFEDGLPVFKVIS